MIVYRHNRFDKNEVFIKGNIIRWHKGCQEKIIIRDGNC